MRSCFPVATTNRRFSSLSSFLLILTLGLVLGPSLLLAQGTGYWHTKGNEIVDSKGETVRIAGINWYGFETADGVVHGLYDQDYHVVLGEIEAEGFNSIRLPFSNQVVESPWVPSAIGYWKGGEPINADLRGLTSMQIMDKVIQAAGQLGLRVILDNHRSEAGNGNDASGLWYSSKYPESKWVSDWVALATRYKGYADTLGNPTVIGMDLRNEPHSIGTSGFNGACWTGDTDVKGCPASSAQNWPAAAERAAVAILKINPSLLIFVEGTDCYDGDCGWQGGNLEGAAKFPVELPVPDRLVYAAHDFGPDLYRQKWFNSGTTAATLDTVWSNYWGYLSESGKAPVWMGEFGTENASSELKSNEPGSQGQWFESMIGYLGNHPAIQWSYWALNGEDSYGLLDGNYDKTPVSALKEDMLHSIRFGLAGEKPYEPCSAKPPAPQGLTAAAVSSTAIELNWDGVTPPAGCAVTYDLYRSTESSVTPQTGELIATSLTQTNFPDKGLTAETKYYYYVESVDSEGSSGSSAFASATTKAGPVLPIACHIDYTVTNEWPGGFQAALVIHNTGVNPISSWTLKWSFADGQVIDGAWNTAETQSGSTVTMHNLSYNGAIPVGEGIYGIGFVGTQSGTNAEPTKFTLNGTVCK